MFWYTFDVKIFVLYNRMMKEGPGRGQGMKEEEREEGTEGGREGERE